MRTLESTMRAAATAARRKLSKNEMWQLVSWIGSAAMWSTECMDRDRAVKRQSITAKRTRNSTGTRRRTTWAWKYQGGLVGVGGKLHNKAQCHTDAP